MGKISQEIKVSRKQGVKVCLSFPFVIFRLFAENIVKNDPDIITLQEVRVDAAFFSPEGRVFYQDVSGEQSKFDGGIISTLNFFLDP